MLDRYPKDVRLAFKHYPLPMHPYARSAAAAALAANNQGKYWQVSHQLFQSSSRLSEAAIQNIARQSGLDMEKFNRDMRSPAILDQINRDMIEAEKASVEGTPAVFINGKALRFGGGEKELEAAVENELKKKKATPVKE